VAETMRVPQALGEQFERDGFVAVPNLITRAEARALKDEVGRILDDVAREERERGEERPPFLQSGVYVGLSQRSEVCRRFARDPRLLDVMEAVIGPNILFWSDKVVFKSEETDYGTPWHQDWPYWKGIHKVTLWLALDDIDESNGCLQLVRGSHRERYEHHAGRGPAGSFGHQLNVPAVDRARVVTVPAPAGTAIVFHDLTLHASHPNNAHTDRYALAITYKDAVAEDLAYPAMTAAAVVRGHGRE
jgi:phytanoyl-CoA hydroxylase